MKDKNNMLISELVGEIMYRSLRRTVIKVIDGDTVQVARKIGKTNIIRLSGYDAPERYQRGYQESKNMLRNMIGGKTVTIRPETRDCYNRIVATVIHNRKNINRRMREII